VVDMSFDKDCVIESDQLGVDRLRVHVRQPSRINPCNPGISGTGDRDREVKVVRVMVTCHLRGYCQAPLKGGGASQL
jgi:hypothetical protein